MDRWFLLFRTKNLYGIFNCDRGCILWLDRRCSARKEENNAPLLYPNFHNNFPHLHLTKYLGIRYASFCKWVCEMRDWYLLPCTSHRSCWTQVAWASGPIWILLLYGWISYSPSDCVSLQNLLEKDISCHIHSSSDVFITYYPFCVGIATLASCQRKKQRSS